MGSSPSDVASQNGSPARGHPRAGPVRAGRLARRPSRVKRQTALAYRTPRDTSAGGPGGRGRSGQAIRVRAWSQIQTILAECRGAQHLGTPRHHQVGGGQVGGGSDMGCVHEIPSETICPSRFGYLLYILPSGATTMSITLNRWGNTCSFEDTTRLRGDGAQCIGRLH